MRWTRRGTASEGARPWFAGSNIASSSVAKAASPPSWGTAVPVASSGVEEVDNQSRADEATPSWAATTASAPSWGTAAAGAAASGGAVAGAPPRSAAAEGVRSKPGVVSSKVKRSRKAHDASSRDATTAGTTDPAGPLPARRGEIRRTDRLPGWWTKSVPGEDLMTFAERFGMSVCVISTLRTYLTQFTDHKTVNRHQHDGKTSHNF